MIDYRLAAPVHIEPAQTAQPPEPEPRDPGLPPPLELDPKFAFPYYPPGPQPMTAQRGARAWNAVDRGCPGGPLKGGR